MDESVKSTLGPDPFVYEVDPAPLTEDEERDLYRSLQPGEPIEIEVDPDAGIVFEVDFDRAECEVLFGAIGDADPFEFIKSAALERAHELRAEADDAGSLTAAD